MRGEKVMGHNWSWCWLVVVELGLWYIFKTIHNTKKKKKKTGVKNEYYQHKYKNIQGSELVKQGQ